MLDFMRRNARSWGIKVALGIICVVFVFFMGGGGQIGGSSNTVATVGKAEISVDDFQRAQTSTRNVYRDQYGGNLPPELLRALDIPGRTLAQLIDSALLEQEASRLGLLVTDESVRMAIRQVPAFQRDGQFSSALYRAALSRQGSGPPAFEADMRHELLVSQLADIIRHGVHVVEAEARERYTTDNEKVTLSFIEFSGDELTGEVEVSDEALAVFFENRSDNYRRDETVSLRYLAYRPEDFDASVTISDERIEEYYILNRESEFSIPEEISARHILKKLDRDADEETRTAAREALEGALKQLETGADFAELAAGLSEDSTADTGGELGRFGRGSMVPAFDRAAFALDAGQISEIVETRFGLHIIRVDSRQEAGSRSLEDARDEIAAKLRSGVAADEAFDTAATDAEEIHEGESTFEQLAVRRSLEIGRTELITRGDIVPELGAAPDLVDAASVMNAPGDVSDPVKLGDIYYIVELAERRPSYVPELDEAHEEVEADYLAREAAELARLRAEKTLEGIEGGKTIAELAEATDRETEESQAFTRQGAFVRGIGNLPGIRELAFATEQGQPLSRVFTSRGKAYVFVVSVREQADPESFDETRDDLLERLRDERVQETFTELLTTLKGRTEIVYNQDIVRTLVP